MKASASDIVRALVELSRSMPQGDGFLKQVRDELNRYVSHESTVVTLVTPSGDAGPLSEQVKKILSQKLGRSVELIERRDPTLIGGAVLQYGDQQIDLSLRGGLHQVASSLRSSSVLRPKS